MEAPSTVVRGGSDTVRGWFVLVPRWCHAVNVAAARVFPTSFSDVMARFGFGRDGNQEEGDLAGGGNGQ
jgi:hypothetical protein